MFYDLNEMLPGVRTDTFSIGGIQYEIGPISKKYRKAILAIDEKKDIIVSWKPVVEGLMKEWNDTTPEMTETNVGAIIPLIIKRLHEDRPQIQV